ncbi:MAG: hypothetical protein WC867_08405 [Candidatus Pacearchaeota archaeon]
MAIKRKTRTKKQKLEEEVCQENPVAGEPIERLAEEDIQGITGSLDSLDNGVEAMHYELRKRKYEGYKMNPSRANYEAGVALVKGAVKTAYGFIEAFLGVPSSAVKYVKSYPEEEVQKLSKNDKDNIITGLFLFRLPGTALGIVSGAYALSQTENIGEKSYWLYSLPFITNMASLAYEIGKYRFEKHRAKIIESYNPDNKSKVGDK